MLVILLLEFFFLTQNSLNQCLILPNILFIVQQIGMYF